MQPKIAIATMIGQNQGNRLQNYALQHILELMSGKAVETLQVDYGPNRLKRAAKRALYPLFPAERWARFEEFDDVNIRYARCSINDCDLPKAGYSLHVIGSDQVWNPYFNFTSDAEYLPQIPSHLKVSYAASFGVTEIVENADRVGNLLKDISRISVREHAGVRLVEKLAGRNAALVLDPTMLLSAADWNLVAKRPDIKIPREGYILKYVLGENVSDKDALLVCQNSGEEIIDLKDKSLPVGPAEFVWLISNARFVCTDSFHASVFSILFHVPFAIFERVSANEDMSSRFDTLCEILSLEGRRTKRGEEGGLASINWTLVDAALDSARQESMRFLEMCLHDANIA